MTKPHKGRIEQWRKLDFSKIFPDQCHDNLGFFIIGRPVGHPDFTKGIRTSPVVKFTDTQIETLNSIYDLGVPEGGNYEDK